VRLRRGGFLGFFGKTVVEVDAYRPTDSTTGQKQQQSDLNSSLSSENREQLRKQIAALTNSNRNNSTESSTAVDSGDSRSNRSNGQSDVKGQEWNVDEPAMPNFSPRDRAREVIEEKSREINGEQANTDLRTYDRTSVSDRSNGNRSQHSREGSQKPSISSSEDEIDELVEKTDLIAEKMDHLVDSLDGSRNGTENNSSPTDFPGELDTLFNKLLEEDVETEFARDLVGRIKNQLEAEKFHDFETIQRQLTTALEEDFQAPEPLLNDQPEPLLVPFVGPTGVGKTTTIAKLAAYYSVEENRSVGFITLDGYRLAAVEQLRRYADILRVPLRDVTDMQEIEDAIEDLSEQDVELIFVDTAGRSQFDREKINELENVFPGQLSTKTHLVISARCRSRDIKSVLNGFGDVGYDRLAVTKIDETEAHGAIYNLMRRAKAPIAYFTDGQEVPDDLWIAEADQIVDLILDQEEG